jgi:hypothetical protein
MRAVDRQPDIAGRQARIAGITRGDDGGAGGEAAERAAEFGLGCVIAKAALEGCR